MTATALSIYHDRLTSFTKPSKEDVINVLNTIQRGKNEDCSWQWDDLLDQGYPYELLVFVKNLPCVTSSASMYTDWVRVRDRQGPITDETFAEIYDKFSDYVTSNILANI